MTGTPPPYVPEPGPDALARRLRSLLVANVPVACGVYCGLAQPGPLSARHAEATFARARHFAAGTVDELPHFISAIYLQMTPVRPMKDSPSKLESLTSVYSHAASLGFKVIAGHACAVTPVLRSLVGASAGPGLAVGDAFDQSHAQR